MKKNYFLILILIIIILDLFSLMGFSSNTTDVKDYIQGKFPSIFQFYLSSLGELDQYEREFIDLLGELPEEEQEYYVKEVYKKGFSLELLNNIKKIEKISFAQSLSKTESIAPKTTPAPDGSYTIDWSPIKKNGWKNPLGEGKQLNTNTAYDFNSNRYIENHTKKHTGIDFDDSKENDYVYSIANGKVVAVIRDESNPMRTVIIIQHTNSNGERFLAIYGHVLAGNDLKVNTEIEAGKKVGVIKTAGTDPHLHFGINTSSVFLDNFFTNNWGFGRIPVSDKLSDYGWVEPIEFLRTNKPFKEVANHALAIIMDRSGSMSGEKIKKEINAAKALIADIPNDNYACLVIFAADAHTGVELCQATPENKERLKSVIETVYASGNTNIGAGLHNGLQELNKVGTSSSHSALLMSDGMHNYGELWPAVEQYESRGWSVHTVAYGDDADRPALENIASRTGGIFFLADTFNISQIYQRISAHTHNKSVLFAYNDKISQGKQLTYKIPIDPDISSATFFIDWQGSIVDLQLKTPDEEIVSHDNFHSFPGVDYQFGDTYSFYEVDKPKPGDWQVTLYGREIDQKSEQVNLTVSGNSPLLANIFGLQSYYRRGEPIQIKVKIADLFTSEQASYSDFKVTAVIKKPSPNMKKMIQKGKIDFGELFLYALTKKKKINLYDDGRHGDWNASDDIYGALYKDTEEIGHYVITITCKAKKADGEEITRVLRESVQVGPMEDRTVTLADFLMVK